MGYYTVSIARIIFGAEPERVIGRMRVDPALTIDTSNRAARVGDGRVSIRILQERPVRLVRGRAAGILEVAQRIAGHADSRTTKLYDRRGQKVLLKDMERIRY
jgi:hypothetical protein